VAYARAAGTVDDKRRLISACYGRIYSGRLPTGVSPVTKANSSANKEKSARFEPSRFSEELSVKTVRGAGGRFQWSGTHVPSSPGLLAYACFILAWRAAGAHETLGDAALLLGSAQRGDHCEGQAISVLAGAISPVRLCWRRRTSDVPVVMSRMDAGPHSLARCCVTLRMPGSLFW
jgi:hypothetical protein